MYCLRADYRFRPKAGFRFKTSTSHLHSETLASQAEPHSSAAASGISDAFPWHRTRSRGRIIEIQMFEIPPDKTRHLGMPDEDLLHHAPNCISNTENVEEARQLHAGERFKMSRGVARGCTRPRTIDGKQPQHRKQHPCTSRSRSDTAQGSMASQGRTKSSDAD